MPFEALTDPKKAQDAIAKELSEAQVSRKSALGVEQRSVETINASQERLMTVLDTAAKQTTETMDEAFAAINRLEGIAQTPKIFSNIVGLFDSDYNADVQKLRLQKSQLKASAISGQVSAAENLHSQVIAREQALLGFASAEAANEAQDVADFQTALSLTGQIEDKFNQRQINDVKKMSVQELQAEAAKPNPSLPKGLLQTELLVKLSAAKAVNLQELAIQQQEASVAAIHRQTQLERSTPEELVSQAEAGTLSGQEVQEEIIRRNQLKVAFETSEVALNANKRDLANNAKNDILNRLLSENQLSELEKQASNTGVVEFNGVKFTSQEITDARRVRQTSNIEARNKEIQRTLLSMGDTAATIDANSRLGQIAKARNPGQTLNPDDPLAGLDLDTQRRMQTIQATMDGLKALSDAGVDVSEQRSTALKEMTSVVDEAVKKYIEEQPEESQKAAEEFAATNRVTSFSNAANLLVKEGTNSSNLNYHPILAEPMQNFANTLAEISQTAGATKFDLSDENLEFVKSGKPIEEVMVEQAMQLSNFRDATAQILFQTELSRNVIELQRDTEIDGKSPYSGLVNPRTGNFADVFFSIDPRTGDRIFSNTKFNTILAAKTLAARDAGLLAEDESLYQMLYDRLRDGSSTLTANYFSGTPLEASVNNAAFNNRPQMAFNELVMKNLQQARQQMEFALKTQIDQLSTARSTSRAVQELDPNQLGGIIDTTQPDPFTEMLNQTLAPQSVEQGSQTGKTVLHPYQQMTATQRLMQTLVGKGISKGSIEEFSKSYPYSPKNPQNKQ